MKIDVFTIRDKSNNELIYAEGTATCDEYLSFFKIEEKWLTDAEKNSEGWRKYGQGLYSYIKEVRFLLYVECDFEKIKFNLEEVEIN